MSRWPVLRMLILSVCPLFPVALFAPAVAAEPPLLPRVVVDADGTGFIQSGTEVEFQASGFNYDHDLQGRLLEDYWHDEWSLVERDFHSMKQLGAAVVRLGTGHERAEQQAGRIHSASRGDHSGD